MEALGWLLEGDPAIRWQALRAVVAGARSGEIGAEGFSTAMVLGRVDLDKVTGIEFVQRRR